MVGWIGDFVLLVGMLVAAWFILIGGTGAALAAIRGGSAVLGFLIAVVVPVPFLGWLIVWQVSNRRRVPVSVEPARQGNDLPGGFGRMS